MSNPKRKYNLKLMIFTMIVVVLLAVAFHFYFDQTKKIIRTALEAKITSFLLATFTILIFIIHYFTHKAKLVESETIITKKFGSFIDNILGGVAYATSITTSLTLLKGLYIQNFFKDKIYFSEFQDLDLMTIFGVTIFLLYISFMKVIDIAKETYKLEYTEQVLNEQRQVVLPKTNQIDNLNENN